jgi:hypothetical protein
LRVFENRVLRRIFGPKMDEVTGEWRRLHEEELYAQYSSPNTIRVIKSRRLRRKVHAARMGDRRSAYRVLRGKHDGRRPPGRPRHRCWIILKLILEKWNRVAWTGSIWLRTGTDGRR